MIHLNSDIKSQQSLHFILGSDYTFRMFDRPFKLSAEAYYKKCVYFAQFRQICNTTNNRNPANFFINSLSIVHKSAVILEHCLFCNHTTKAPGTDQQELFLRHWECPSARSGRTRWS